jgi:hypothetical protein
VHDDDDDNDDSWSVVVGLDCFIIYGQHHNRKSKVAFRWWENQSFFEILLYHDEIEYATVRYAI